ncbi:hypothetical protein [Barrientosiimonas endolithica]|uniref:ATP dependent DNA ligase n=1 Tax=Barrientosiimonas endolithica TaxID=1535208 RepID=UPI003305A91D
MGAGATRVRRRRGPLPRDRRARHGGRGLQALGLAVRPRPAQRRLAQDRAPHHRLVRRGRVEVRDRQPRSLGGVADRGTDDERPAVSGPHRQRARGTHRCRAAPRLRELPDEGDPFVDDVPRAERAGATWVRPSLVVDLEFHGISEVGRLRQPTWKGLRPDLTAADLTPADLTPKDTDA